MPLILCREWWFGLVRLVYIARAQSLHPQQCYKSVHSRAAHLNAAGGSRDVVWLLYWDARDKLLVSVLFCALTIPTSTSFLVQTFLYFLFMHFFTAIKQCIVQYKDRKQFPLLPCVQISPWCYAFLLDLVITSLFSVLQDFSHNHQGWGTADSRHIVPQ